MSKVEYFTTEGHRFSHKSEMTLTFINNFKKITLKYYLKQPKILLEWRFFEKLAIFIKAFDRTLSHPLIRGSCNVDPVEIQDQNMELIK